MYIDLDGKAVTFITNTTLTLAQLWSLIELLDDEVDDDLDVLAKLHPKGGPVFMCYIESFTTPGKDYLIVQLADGTWLCSCEDWTKRNKYDSGETCKHIRHALKWG